jgi:membrane-associated phospholipid phosphatase
MGSLRRCEWVVAAYFAYACALSLWLPVSPAITRRVWLVNLALAAVGAVVVRFAPLWLRDYGLLSLMLLGYQEMGWFALPHADRALEESWLVWDRLALDTLRGRALIECLGPVIPFALEVSYPLVYTMATFGLSVVYARRMQDRADELLFPVFLATFAAYAMFPWFPSEPPRTLWPDLDLPNYSSPARAFNYWFLGGAGIHTGVFPSAHVSSAFSVALALRRMMPEVGWAWRSQLVLAILIAVSVVYGRYHYLVDSVAGLALALVAWVAAEPTSNSRLAFVVANERGPKRK